MRNRIELTIIPEDDETLDMAFERTCKKINIVLLPVNTILNLLDLNRLTFEQKMLNIGLKHYEIKVQDGKRTRIPRQRIFVNPEDLINFLFNHCSMVVEMVHVRIIEFEKKTSLKDITSRKFKNVKKALLIEKHYMDNSDEDLGQELIDLFVQNKWLSLAQLQEKMNRARSSSILLGRVIDSIVFTLPGSKRQLRRYLLTHDINMYYELQKLVFRLPIVTE